MRTNTHVIPSMHDLFTPAEFEAHLRKTSDQMWQMYERPMSRTDFEDEEVTTVEEDLATLTGAELDQYLDDWADNVPPEVFEALALRRSRRLADAWKEARAAFHRAAVIADEAYWLLWHTLPTGRKGEASSDLHMIALNDWMERLGAIADEAERAYFSR